MRNARVFLAARISIRCSRHAVLHKYAPAVTAHPRTPETADKSHCKQRRVTVGISTATVAASTDGTIASSQMAFRLTAGCAVCGRVCPQEGGQARQVERLLVLPLLANCRWLVMLLLCDMHGNLAQHFGFEKP